ncbi:MAG: hypothetical protein ACI3XX_01730, partial [Eubacteriales bacterium]
ISYLGANGDLNGFNMFAYCSNNPVMCVDYTGNSLKDVFKNFFLNIWKSFQAEIGVGFGIGFTGDIEGVETSAELSHDTTVFLVDGEIATGNKVTAQLSANDIGIGGEHTHYTDCTDYYYDKIHHHGISDNVIENAQMIINCDKCDHSYNMNSSNINLTNNGDIVIGVGASFHVLLGGHVFAGFNVTKWAKGVVDDFRK